MPPKSHKIIQAVSVVVPHLVYPNDQSFYSFYPFFAVPLLGKFTHFWYGNFWVKIEK